MRQKGGSCNAKRIKQSSSVFRRRARRSRPTTGQTRAGIDFSARLREPRRPTPMQHVSAFSRPQTVPAVSVSVPKRDLWLLNSWRALVLYVGTPLLLAPVFGLAEARGLAWG